MTVDYYNKITDNLLLDVTKAPSIGMPTAKENMGKLANSGIELQARVVAVTNKEWNWSLSVTMQHNKNKIKKISNSLKILNDSLNTQASRMPPPIYEEGHSISAVKAVKSGGIDPATGPGDFYRQGREPDFRV